MILIMLLNSVFDCDLDYDFEFNLNLMKILNNFHND